MGDVYFAETGQNNSAFTVKDAFLSQIVFEARLQSLCHMSQVRKHLKVSGLGGNSL